MTRICPACDPVLGWHAGQMGLGVLLGEGLVVGFWCGGSWACGLGGCCCGEVDGGAGLLDVGAFGCASVGLLGLCAVGAGGVCPGGSGGGGSVDVCEPQDGAGEVGVGEVGAGEVCSCEVCVGEVGAGEV